MPAELIQLVIRSTRIETPDIDSIWFTSISCVGFENRVAVYRYHYVLIRGVHRFYMDDYI